MKPAAGVVVGVVAGAIAYGLWRAAEGTRLHASLTRRNARGAPVSTTLGLALGVGVLGAIGAVGVGAGGSAIAGAEVLGVAIVFLTGIVDDVVPGTTRGLRGHLTELGRGRVTTGSLKLVAATLAAVLLVAQAGGTTWERIAGVVLVAGATNLWNLLDVQPGRAWKGYLVAACGLLVADPGAVLIAASGPVIALGWPDLRERGMLGDAGANVLGFVIGAEAYVRLPTAGVVVGALVVVCLTVVADTVTLSRVIDGIPPLRWFDRLGRVTPAGPPAGDGAGG